MGADVQRPGRRKLIARPGHPGQQEIGLTFAADTLPPRHDRDARQTLLERTFADAGWRARELLDAARLADDFALDLCEQIHLPRWHDGRVVLLGDSAWCSSPLSGLGTAMALRGAAELATCLHAARIATNPSRLPAALAAFEQTMRPRATRVQHLPPGRIAAAAPRTALGIRCNAWVMRAVQSPLLRPLVNHAIAHSEYASTPPRNGMPATLHSD
ncbi:MAG TPA: FAD-dependent monooxygenase [Rhodanobacteraceae bacterium]